MSLCVYVITQYFYSLSDPALYAVVGAQSIYQNLLSDLLYRFGESQCLTAQLYPYDSTNRHGAIQPMLRCLSPDAVLDHKCMPLQYMGTYRDAGYSMVGVILMLGYIHYCMPIAMVIDTSMISL